MTIQTSSFDGAQTFYIDPAAVGGAKQVMISSIDLYFKHKPSRYQSYSGSPVPGVTVFIAETVYGVPKITSQSPIFTRDAARVGYNNIYTSSDASVPTKFRFAMPYLVDTDKEYAIVWRFDYSDQFVLWTSVQGDILVQDSVLGTSNAISPGPSGKFAGNYFGFFSIFVDGPDIDLDQYMKNWRSESGTDLKFKVYVARYAHNLFPVGANSAIDPGLIHENALANTVYDANGTSFDVRFGSYEFVSYDQATSLKNSFVGGQGIFQNTVSYPGGKAALKIQTTANSFLVTANSSLPNGQAFVWSNLFPANSVQNYFVLKSGNTVNIRRIANFISNTVVELNEPVTFTNTLAEFMVTPTGIVSGFDKNSPFGISDSFVLIANSNANSSVRFVNNTIESISITAGGTGYSNNDRVFIYGYETVGNEVSGGYKAMANVTTNSTGGITTVHIVNSGAGFVNTSAITVSIANSSSANISSNTSAGSGATFNYGIGATLRTDMTNNTFKACKFRNLDIGEFIPYLELKNPPGVDCRFQIELPYYKVKSSNTFSGESFYVATNSGNNLVTVQMYAPNYTENINYIPIIPSKSNEYAIKYADGSPNDKITNSSSFYSLSFHLKANTTSNSDFTCSMIKGLPSVYLSKYIINNDYTGEMTDSGNAWARHITKTFNFERPAEDLRVYLTAYRPANTDLKVYAKVYKKEDPDSFDDKEWTELQMKNTSVPTSSSADTSNYVEYTYGLYQYPQNRTELAGVASTTLNSTTITGSNTTFTSSLVTGSLVLMRQELFPDNHVVAVVNAVTNNTSFTITEPVSNTSLVTSGLKIDLINTPHQTYNNIQKDNVCRYHNTSVTKFDGIDSVALKVVFLSDSPHRIPRIDDIKAVGVSA